MKKVFLFLVAFFGLETAVWSHEFFVMTDNKTPKSGDKVPLYVLSTHYFTVGEELEGLKYNKVWTRQGGRRTELTLKENPDRVWYETEFTLQGDGLVIVEGNRIGEYTTRFTDGTSFAGTPADARKTNPNKTIARATFLEKFSKTYINPSPRDTAFSTPLGYTLEIIPLDNPGNLKKGSNARFRVLYKGQPLSGGEVFAVYDYYDYKTMNAYEQKGITDRNGEITFKISNPGIWILRIRDSRNSAVPDVGLENVDSIIVFTVPQ
ncbi:MAG: DUF4198 domain-containing protein [Treponema sp.]|jgi:uncharacterized GH25 family protein|nr:DUF4198 domain-containing protein [Treponema sp.]